jgi:hypothetical protein
MTVLAFHVRHEALQPQTIVGAIRHSACDYDLRHLLRLLPNLRPPFLRRLHNRRSASSRQNAFLRAYDFALSGMSQGFCSRSHTA